MLASYFNGALSEPEGSIEAPFVRPTAILAGGLNWTATLK